MKRWRRRPLGGVFFLGFGGGFGGEEEEEESARIVWKEKEDVY